MIHIQQISKTYGNKTALHSLTAEIVPGMCTALCGGNGAGKSTLLYMLAGILKPDSGKISGMEQYTVGYMPDHLSLPTGVSARHWLLYLAKLKQVRKQRVDEVLDVTGLLEVADREPSTYSRGMMQRLLFAQMILGKPDVLLMDEPGNGLDPFWVEEWKDWVQRYREKGATIIFSSHLLHDVLAVADHILLIHRGHLLANETADTWREDSRTPEQRFLEMSKNFL
ncbi:ABC transporter ATP-binding protein [Aneurinibacillus terranovensis]|uniref:ABC transporter ATP-binding protein n=1 Tax=Aneurinibacillus terranovensis TaxID=278991 RepID=UPI0003F6EE0E|nr:ABC transporter ATP-binding protein [Aneurinibacillus terranovensis]